MYAGIAIGVLAIVGVVALMLYIAKGSARLTPLWAAMLVVVLGAGWFAFNIAGIYFRMPIGWVIALVTAAVVTVALFVLVGKSVSWRPLKVAATVGLMVLGFVLTTILAIALPSADIVTPLFIARAEQIAEANDFVPLFPSEGTLNADYLPVDTIGPDKEGLSLQYERFLIQERRAEGALTVAELEAILAVGADPLGMGMAVTEDAAYETFEIDGGPALGAEFTEAPEGGAPRVGGLPEKQSLVRMLVFQKDGVDVRIHTVGTMDYQGGSRENERYEYLPPLEFGELVEIAESLAPLD